MATSMINTTTAPSVSREERIKQLQQRYDKYEQAFKMDKEYEIKSILTEVAQEIEDLTTGKLVDPVQIQVLFGTYLPKLFKSLLSKRYYHSEIERQYTTTLFINLWMKNRVPSLRYFFNQGGSIVRDPIHAEIGIVKELEILELILNGDSDIYNYNYHLNNPSVEDRLHNHYQNLGVLPEDEVQTHNTDEEMAQTQNAEKSSPEMAKDVNYEVAKVKRPGFNSHFFIHNINVFSMFKGFEGLLSLLNASSEEAQMRQRSQHHGLSMVRVCMTVLTILGNVKSMLVPTFWSSNVLYGQKVVEACYDFVVNRCTGEDLRTAQKKDIMYFSNNVESILDSITHNLTQEQKVEQVYKISETLELELALKCLKCAVLEKKLIGHQILISQIVKVRNLQKSTSQQPASSRQGQLNLQGLITKRWLTSELMLQWLDDNKVFDLVFGDSLHSEVIKKCYTLLEFLYSNGRITIREMDKMWECATKKHEAYKVAILKALTFLASRAKIEDLKYLFYKLKLIPLPEIDKFSLELVKQIAKKLAGDDSVASPAKRILGSRRNAAIGPALPPGFSAHQRSNSGDRNISNKQARFKNNSEERLNNSFTNEGVKDNRNLTSTTQELFSLDKVMLHKKSLNKGKRAGSGERLIKPNINSTLLEGPGHIGNLKDLDGPCRLFDDQQQAKNDQQLLRMEGDPLHQINQDLNPLEVPADREDKKTADEDMSFSDQAYNDGRQMNDIFNTSLRDDNNNTSNSAQGKKNQADLEEEKVGADMFDNQSQSMIATNLQELLQDQTLGISEEDKRLLAQQILDYLWVLCLESSVSQHDLSMQTHKQAIEDLTYLITNNYQKSLISYIGRCIQSLQLHQSVMSMHVILQKLIMNTHYPLEKGKQLPGNRQELIAALDKELSLTNVCLSSYIEFKRISLAHIFDQMGSQEHEQENLETQSSLDNEDERSNNQNANTQMAMIQSGVTETNDNRIGVANNAQGLIGTPHSVGEGSQLQKEVSASLQEDQVTVQSSGSLFVSPRMKVEEEFKIPKQHRTQSFRDDPTTVGIPNVLKPSSSDINNVQFEGLSPDQFVHSNRQALFQSSSVPSGQVQTTQKHFNSQTKKQTTNSRAVIESGLIPQTNLAQNQFRMEQANNATQQNNNNNVAAGVNPNNNVNRDFLNTLVTNEVYKYSYYEEVHLRLDFLKFLIGSCPQILKPQQLHVLWECLVVNAFYERERDLFFNWCSQILKASQNIPRSANQQGSQIAASESIFNDDCLEMLYFDTLLKLDFRYITEVMYECFERYFIYINEQYGQIVTSNQFESAFEVFETKLIGVEALWEILLCARNKKVYTQAAEFLHKIYKKMSPTLIDRLNEIKEDLLQTCMEQIKAGYTDIRRQIGDSNPYDVPIYQYSQSYEDPKNRIARSISQLCKFIDEFEGLRDKSARSQLSKLDREINILGKNNIGNPPQPAKMNFTRPVSTKLGALREEFANAIFPKKQARELQLMYKGKILNEDMKTLKDLGVSENDQQMQFMISLKTEYELELVNKQEDQQENQEYLKELTLNLKGNLIEMGCADFSDEVIKLALKKCNMNMEEAVVMFFDEDKVNDLQEEVRKNEEANQNNNIVMIEENKDEPNPNEEQKLNLIISNRSEYFDLLFELLNLGINEITNAAWNLLIQIPVNKTLLQQIRTLSIISEGSQENWNYLIDPTNTYKMLYSIQIVNSLISVNNEKLSEAEIQERYEWRLRFLELGGFEHLYQILITCEPEEFLGQTQQAQRISAPQTKKKGSKNQPTLSRRSNEIVQTGDNAKDTQQIQNNHAKCLGYLISIVKTFIQAALLTTDEEKLLTLIVQSSTSPFRKPKTMKSALQSVPQSKFTSIMFGGNTSQQQQFASGPLSDRGDDNSRDNSSVYTPKFQSSHSSTPQCQTPNPNEKEEKSVGGDVSQNNSQMNKSVDTVKAETVFSQQTLGVKGNEAQNQLYTQVDDFPRLVEQISGSIAQNLLDKVVNFNGLISKLLNILHKAVMFCDSQEVSSLVQHSLDLLLPCIVWRPQMLLKEIYQFENLEALLIRTLMHNSNENVRRSIERTFKVICSESLDITSIKPTEQMEIVMSEQQLQPPKVYILSILLKNLPDVDVKSDYCEEFFNLITQLMKQCQQYFKPCQVSAEEQESILNVDSMSASQLKQQFIQEENSFSALALLQWCIYQLKMRPTFEDRYNQYTDKVLAGYLQLTQSVLEINLELKNLTKSRKGSQSSLVKMIFDFLFMQPSLEDQQSKHQRLSSSQLLLVSHQQHAQQSDQHPKCKRKFTRKKAFNLLLTLCQQQEDNYVQLLQELYEFHAQVQKSQKVVSFSDFDNEVGMRSASGYVGLKNFGCTCYMNALIQQLFMIPDFRKVVLEADVNDTDLEHNVLYQLKLIFANLQESEKQYYAPLGFTKAFTFHGEPVNVRVQQDTYEFFSMLCDNIEGIVKDTPFSSMIKDTVGGVLGNETKSLEEEYPYVGEREEPFLAIQLDIKNKKTLAEALDLYIKPDHLEGDNKYLCEKHNRKVNAQRRSYLKKLGNTVIINLKRFEFDYNNMQRFKVNDYCEFPERINFKPWTKEGIRERERTQKRRHNNNNQDLQEEGKTGNDLVEDVLSENDDPQSFDEPVSDNGCFEDDDVPATLLPGQGSKKNRAVSSNAAAGEAIDEDMMLLDGGSLEGEEEMDEDGNAIMMNTGKYFDEGVMEDFIDIVADEEGSSGSKRGENASSQRKPQTIGSQEEQKKGGANGVTKEGKQRQKKRTVKDENYYEYELVGVLVHSGTADGGHYYSFIKERNGERWLQFDDSHVREFDKANLGSECFGGNQDVNGMQRQGVQTRGLLDDFGTGGNSYERWRNAYLLFYERVEPVKKPIQSSQLMTPSKTFINGIESSVYQRIWDENAAFMKLKIFFDQEYFSFARDYIGLYHFENVLFFGPDSSSTQRHSKLIELTTSYLDQLNESGPTLKSQMLKKQQTIEKESADDSNIFNNNDVLPLRDRIAKDPGLHAIKLATILSQDIILKVKDWQSFVQWMQALDSLFERHAEACVWLIKYLTENKRLLEEILLENMNFEVRESFAKLLTTAISVTVKNEEPYLFKSDDILYFQVDKQNPTDEAATIERQSIPRSAVSRFMSDVYFSDRMLDKVLRDNWRRFDEYFQVLSYFVHIGFPETKFMITQQNSILRLLEFTMNSTEPFFSNVKPRMGDKSQEPNFQTAVDVLSILVRSCFTSGIKRVNQFSPESIYQEDDKLIDLPFDHDQNRFPLLTNQCFTSDLMIKANPNNDSLMRMVVHLCWGDPETSSFFINELMTSIRNRRTTEDLVYHFKILSKLMIMNDEFQNLRLEEVFLFSLDSQASTSLGRQGMIMTSSYQLRSFFNHLESLKNMAIMYVLKMLQFFGQQALLGDPTHHVLNFMRAHKQNYKGWVEQFLLHMNLKGINSPYNVEANTQELVKSCIDMYKQIFEEDSMNSLGQDLSSIKFEPNPTNALYSNPQSNLFQHQVFDDDFITGGGNHSSGGPHHNDGDETVQNNVFFGQQHRATVEEEEDKNQQRETEWQNQGRGEPKEEEEGSGSPINFDKELD